MYDSKIVRKYITVNDDGRVFCVLPTIYFSIAPVLVEIVGSLHKLVRQKTFSQRTKQLKYLWYVGHTEAHLAVLFFKEI